MRDDEAVAEVTADMRRKLRVRYDGLAPRTALPLLGDLRTLVRSMRHDELPDVYDVARRRVRREP